MKIDFNPNLFNDLYWHLKKDLKNPFIRYIFLYGGSSASKTYTYVQSDITALLEHNNENVMVLRKYGVDIKDSIYSDYVKIINDWGLQEYFKCQINYIECLLTGSYIRFRGLDDSEKIKGLANFKRVVLEEISQFDEVDLKQIRKRLRGRENQQIVGLFNPISEEHWLKTNLFDKENLIEQPITTNITSHFINDTGNFVIYKVTYLNNKYIVGPHFVDQHTIDDFEKDKLTDFNYYQIYGLGNWGKLRTGGEFWKDFNTNKHVIKSQWNKTLPIHLSWDENVNPHITCLVWQIEGKTATQIDEICLPDPRNRVLDVCNEFKKRYPKESVKGLFIYGDRTSIKEDTKLEKGENFFTKIQQNLSEYSPKLRMQSVNPSVVQSGTFINEIYRNSLEKINIFVSDICKKSLYDYQYALEDSDGTIKKSKKTNPLTKVSYEEFGHCSDAKRYFITVAFATEYQNYLRGGKATNISVGRTRSKSGY
jgi:phage terminase large subunit